MGRPRELLSEQVVRIIKLLSRVTSIRKTAELCGTTPAMVQRVKNRGREG